MKVRCVLLVVPFLAFTMLAQPVRAQYSIPSDGLVSWWQGSGDASDSQGSNDGVLMNGPEFSLGVSGHGFVVDGADDFVLVSQTPGIDGGAQMTVMGWARPQSAPATAGSYTSLVVIGDFMQASWNSGQCRLVYGSPYNFGSANAARFYMDCGINDANAQVWRETDVAYATGVWHLVVAVFDSGSIDLYVDGELANGNGSSSPGATINSDAENYLSLGAHYRTSDTLSVNFFQGQLDEVAVFSRALDAAEIRAVFDAAYSTSGHAILASNLRFTGVAGTLGAGGSTWAAGGFTTDASVNFLTGVTGAFRAWVDGDLTLALFSDDGGDPGTQIASLGTVAFAGSDDFFAEFTPPSAVVLEPDTSYWVVASSTGSASFLVADSTQQEGSCAFIASHRQSFDAGGSWGSFSSTLPPQLHVEGLSGIFVSGFESGQLDEWSTAAP